MWPHWVFTGALGLSLVVVSGAHSLALVWGLRIAVASLVVHRGLWGVRASAAAAHGPESPGPVAGVHRLNCPVKRGIFLTRYRTRVPWISRKTLNHWAAREASLCLFLSWLSSTQLSTFRRFSILFLVKACKALTSHATLFNNSWTIRGFVPCGWHDLLLSFRYRNASTKNSFVWRSPLFLWLASLELIPSSRNIKCLFFVCSHPYYSWWIIRNKHGFLY